MAVFDVRASERALLGQGHQRFTRTLTRHGLGALTRERVTTLQVNVGKQCNQACHHCHVEAGPKRTEIMTQRTAERLMTLLQRTPSIGVLDITGGAPELCPSFRYLAQTAFDAGRQIIVRHNLTVQFEPGMADLVDFFAARRVEVVASLPCYSKDNVEAQRGKGVFGKSIDALRALNAVGYGVPGSGLVLNLVYNPGGAFLPPAQPALEATYKRELAEHFGVTFNGLFTITNMPIKRFAQQLLRAGEYDAYMALLTGAFNARTVDGLMCRSLVSVSWDGLLYDCDFNQMLELSTLPATPDGPQTIWDLEHLDALDETVIATGSHCFGCTAGAGSSCGGALA